MPRRDETFLLYYWEDFEQYELDNPSCYYCLSESTIQIILSALRFSGWRTRWRLDRNDPARRMESNFIWNKIDALSALAQKEVLTDMTCDLQAGFETLATAIENASPNEGLLALAAAIGRGGGSSSCCADDLINNQHGGYAGFITQPGTEETIPIFGTQPPLSVAPGEFPEGFDSEEEYLLDKCQVANLIVDGVINSLRGLGALGVFNYIAVAGLIVLAITGAIIFPPAFVPVAAAAIGLLALEITVLTLAANAIQDNREEWVCTLYNSDSAEAAIGALANFIDGLVASLDLTGPKGMAVKQIILLLVNADTLNQLFSKVAHLNYPDADCAACESDCYTFDSDLEGWTYQEAFVVGFFNGGAISWQSEGYMRQSNDGSTAYAGAISPTFSHIIESGDHIQQVLAAVLPSGGVFSSYAGAVIDGVQVDLGSATGSTSAGTYNISLEAYVGQEITQIFFGWAKVGGFSIDFDSVCIVNL